MAEEEEEEGAVVGATSWLGCLNCSAWLSCLLICFSSEAMIFFLISKES